MAPPIHTRPTPLPARLLLAILPLIATGWGCAAVERACVYHPVQYPDGDWQPTGLDFEDAWFTAEDGTRLHGWFVPCENPTAVILFAHGVSGNVSSLAEPLKAFCQRHDAAVLAFDYRGYGRSEGSPSEQGLYQDARAARRWLAERMDISESEIVLMGRSLGGAVMVELAASAGARGLVLESTFTSLPDVARQHCPHMPVGWMMRTRFDSLSKIGEYHGPLLLSHGDADRVINFAKAERLFASANEPKQFIRIAGADHQDPPDEAYHQELSAFLASLRDDVTLVRLPAVYPH